MQNHELLLIGERHLKCNVSLMSWSSKRDLLCLAIDNGDLQLYRLSSFEKVWSLPSTEKDSRINSICWRPDGCGNNIAVLYIYTKNLSSLSDGHVERPQNILLVGDHFYVLFWSTQIQVYQIIFDY